MIIPVSCIIHGQWRVENLRKKSSVKEVDIIVFLVIMPWCAADQFYSSIPGILFRKYLTGKVQMRFSV